MPGTSIRRKYTPFGRTIGDANAPLLYAFIDPDCPHCKEFLKNAEAPYLTTKKIQLRVIPVGVLGDESMRRAAYLLAQPNAGELLLAHAKKEKTLPAPEGLTLDGQQLNTDLFELWRFDGTPILVFKAKDGQIMMVRGLPKDFPANSPIEIAVGYAANGRLTV